MLIVQSEQSEQLPCAPEPESASLHSSEQCIFLQFEFYHMTMKESDI